PTGGTERVLALPAIAGMAQNFRNEKGQNFRNRQAARPRLERRSFGKRCGSSKIGQQIFDTVSNSTSNSCPHALLGACEAIAPMKNGVKYDFSACRVLGTSTSMCTCSALIWQA